MVIIRGFSPFIINQAINKFIKPPWNSILSNVVKIKLDNSAILPFHLPLCFKLAKILKRFNFKVIFKPVNKFKFPSTKSPIPKLCKWGIYKVPWKDNLLYIDQTKRNLETHLSEQLVWLIKRSIILQLPNIAGVLDIISIFIKQNYF